MEEIIEYLESIEAGINKGNSELSEEIPFIMRELYEKIKNAELPYGRIFDIEEAIKKLLSDMGLSEEYLYFIQFNLEEIKKIDKEYLVIGHDFGTDICVNQNGEIVSVDPEHEYPTRFINKNLESLFGCIAVYLSYANKITDATDDNILGIIKEIERKFDQIDVQALSNEENWWSIILEQLEY
ncbi:MAG: hypothetical protein HDT30_05690 [Clostridiales bacterium]|nr:hypothetical protein [Clostridiales bacterium]